MFYVEAFGNMVDTKNAFFAHYPVAGGYFEQPWRTMEILNIVLSEYRKYITKKLKQ